MSHYPEHDVHHLNNTCERADFSNTKSCTSVDEPVKRVGLNANFGSIGSERTLNVAAANVIDFSAFVGMEWTHVEHVGIAPVRKPVSTSVKTNMSCTS